MMNNPYEVLDIREGAGMDEIKRAYRRKAKEYHPDLHPEDPRANEKMQQINEAYDRLCNPDKYARQQQARPEQDPYAAYRRRAYDDYARQYQSQRGGWQYTYYTTSDDGFGPRRQRPAAPLVNPLRGIARFIGGIMMFRFVVAVLRLLMFGFLR